MKLEIPKDLALRRALVHLLRFYAFPKAKKSSKKLFLGFLFPALMSSLWLLSACSSEGDDPTNEGARASCARGFGSCPQIITSYAQLKAMAEGLGKRYKLGGDIDASPSLSEGAEGCTPYDPDAAAGNAGHPDYADTCAGWVPLGSDSVRFIGSLDGDGYRIRNLYAKAAGSAGLFAYSNGANIQKLGLSEVYIQGGDDTGALIGNMIGGSISQSYVSGRVIGTNGLGGLVGKLRRANISRSYSAGRVAGSTRVGGLVGSIRGVRGGISNISNSYSKALVAGSNTNLGGLVGRVLVNNLDNSVEISNTYATGDVTGEPASTMMIGGLVGALNALSGGEASISNSYAAGKVSMGMNLGAFVGAYRNNSRIRGRNYYVGSDGTNGIGADNPCANTVCIRATGADDVERRTWLQNTLDESTAAPAGLGWDSDIWGNFTSDYPCLKNMPAGAPACP